MDKSAATGKTRSGNSGRWFLGLFGLPFAAVGIGIFGWVLLPVLLDWRAAQDWVAVEAELLSAELESHSSDGSTTWQATARYRYDYAANTWENDRVGLHGGSDNVGDFQQQLGERLERALARGETVTAWVNPAHPQEALLDRELRTGLLAMMGLFALLFGGAGLAMVGAAVFARGDAAGHSGDEAAREPWRARSEWATPRVVSDARGSARALWVFAVLWCAVSLPGNFFMAEELANGNYAILVLLLFDAVGIGLVVWAARSSASVRKFGVLVAELDPHPGAIGGDVAGYIDIPVEHDPARLFRVSLSCLHSRTSGSGKNRSTRQNVLWSDDRHLHAEPLGAGQVRLWFRFEPPTGLPESTPPSDDYHAWRLEIAAGLPGLDLSRQFDLPVFATAARSTRNVGARVQASPLPDLAAVEALAQLEQIPGGASMRFRAGRHWLSGLLLLLLFGGGFGGGGVAVWLADADIVTTVVLGGVLVLVGGLCAAGGLWLLGNSLRVEVDAVGARVHRRLFGIPVRNVDIPRADLLGVGILRGGSTTTGTRTVVHYDLVLRLPEDRWASIGDGFRGASQATLAAKTFADCTRLPMLGEIDRSALFAARKAARRARRDDR